ncbi:MAG: hypothetical protein ABSA49_11550 [Rhizomicrobium sp.]
MSRRNRLQSPVIGPVKSPVIAPVIARVIAPVFSCFVRRESAASRSDTSLRGLPDCPFRQRISKPHGSMCDVLHGKTLNMATRFLPRNATKPNPENKVGTKIETLANFARDFIDVSGS